MVNWHKFTGDDHTLEFYPDHFVIKHKKSATGYQMLIPKTIDSFILTMNLFGVQLYWTQWIDDNFEPKEYLNADEIKEYFTGLLTKMKKSHELL
jgi:hypothetical protein